MHLRHTHAEFPTHLSGDAKDGAPLWGAPIEVARRLAVAIEHLPAVATLDWCDRAAACVAAHLHGCAAAVLLESVGEDGALSHVEAVGVAAGAEERWHEGDGVSIAERLNTVRSELEPLRTLPWRIDSPWAWSAKEAGGGAWESTPIARAFAAFRPGDVGVSVCHIPGGSGGRSLVLLLAQGVESGPNHQKPAGADRLALLGSACTHLAERAAIAIGVERCTRGRWISEREREVLDHLVLGKSVREIAAEIDRSTHTIHDHVKSLHRKLGATSRGELVARALGHRVARQEVEIERAAPGPRPRADRIPFSGAAGRA